jgi:hypothetical protein
MKCRCLEARERSWKVNQALYCGVFQYAQGTYGHEHTELGFFSPVRIVNQQQMCVELLRQGNRFPFPSAQFSIALCVQRLTRLLHLKPRGRTCNPCAHCFRCAWPLEVHQDGRRNNHALIEDWQDGVVLNQHKVIDRGGVSNDQHLEAEPTVRLTILLKVFEHIPQRHVMFLEKTVDFQPRFIAQ